MFMNYMLPEFKELEEGRRNELLERARFDTAKRSTLFNLLFPICLFISFGVFVVAPLVLIEPRLGGSTVWFYVLFASLLSSLVAWTSFHLFRAKLLVPALRRLMEGELGESDDD